MTKIANEMKLNIVAEGIESLEQFIKLKKIGCHQLRGYLISRPLSRDFVLPYLVTQ